MNKAFTFNKGVKETDTLFFWRLSPLFRQIRKKGLMADGKEKIGI